MKLNERLSEIQVKLIAPKSQYNKFGKYPYRNCEDILGAVKPLLCGLTIIISDDISVMADRVYVKATASITDGENTISSTSFAREPLSKKGMDESQITGAASSYARKYALNGLLLIDDTKDADSQDNKVQADNAWTVSNAYDKFWSLTEAERNKVWSTLAGNIQSEINREN